MNFEEYEKKIIKQTKAIGTYKKEFSIVISTLSKLMEDYDTAIEEFNKSGGEIVISHTNKAKETNIVKNPFYLSLETMRVQILKYLGEVGLTPAGLKKINEKALQGKKQSSLVKALRSLE